MNPQEREFIRRNLKEINLLLRAIWRKGKAQIKEGEELQKLVKKTEAYKERIYRLLDKEGQRDERDR